MPRRDLDDDAPWLAEASPAPRTEVSRRSFFWTLAVLLGLAAVGAIGLILLLSKKDGGSTQGYMNAEQAPLISAESGPYKQLPKDPKGLAIEGQDQTIYAAGEGIDQGSTIDLNAVPEEPLGKPAAPHDLLPPDPAVQAPLPAKPAVVAPAAKPAVVAPVAKPAVVPPAVVVPAKIPTKPAASPPTPVTSPSSPPARPALTLEIPAAKPATTPKKPEDAPYPTRGAAQLGAFSNEAKADAAWAALAAKGVLGGYQKRVIRLENGDKTLWRLRASGGDAAALCSKLRASGDACSVVE